MAALVAAIHVGPLRAAGPCCETVAYGSSTMRRFPDVDGRNKGGHDVLGADETAG
jgi:hypothetical protein